MNKNKLSTKTTILSLLVVTIFCLNHLHFSSIEAKEYKHNQTEQYTEVISSVKRRPENYLPKAIGPTGEIVRWGKKSIKVFIPQNNYNQTIQSAFTQWEVASNSTITFLHINDESSSDIRVIFTSNMPQKLGGLTKTYYRNNTIIKADIFLPEKTPQNELLNEKTIHMLAIHEIGHSLGIIGHSDNAKDIMSTSDITQLQGITKADANTLRLLYSTEKKQLASKRSILEQKLADQNKVVKKDPNNAVQIMILGDIYKNMKEYKTAINIYEKAIKIDDNLAQAYYSIGSCYYKDNQKNKALLFFKQAKEKEPDNVIFSNTYDKILKEIHRQN